MKMENLLPNNIIDINEDNEWEKKFLDMINKKREKIEKKKNKKHNKK